VNITAFIPSDGTEM